jgi:hypothetical protein
MNLTPFQWPRFSRSVIPRQDVIPVSLTLTVNGKSILPSFLTTESVYHPFVVFETDQTLCSLDMSDSWLSLKGWHVNKYICQLLPPYQVLWGLESFHDLWLCTLSGKFHLNLAFGDNDVIDHITKIWAILIKLHWLFIDSIVVFFLIQILMRICQSSRRIKFLIERQIPCLERQKSFSFWRLMLCP